MAATTSHGSQRYQQYPQYPLSPPMSPPDDLGAGSPYAVRPIPPHRSSTQGSSVSSSLDLLANSSNAKQGHQTRDRRQSQASNGSSDSRRNSGQLAVNMRYPSPAPSSPASSPTHAQAQFISTASFANSPAASTSGSATGGPEPNQFIWTTGRSNNVSSSSSSSSSAAPTAASSTALLQGIEAQLQIPPFRGGPAANTRSRRESGNTDRTPSPLSTSIRVSESDNQAYNAGAYAQQPATAGVTGPTHRIPAQHQAQHRPASTNVIPVPTVQQPYPSQAAANFLYPTSPDMRTPLSQSTRAPIVTSANTTSAITHIQQANAAAAAHRNRASHQIVPVSASQSGHGSYQQQQQPVNIALHTAQYTNSSRPKLFFGNYQLLHTLGEGEFGKVKLGVHAQRWGEEVAIKLIKKGNLENAARHVKVQREIDVLKVVRHPHIVRQLEVIETDRYIGIVLEYASGGELFEYILAHKHLRENMACKLFAQLISGVGYLHSKRIVHRDLKLENLLLDRNRNIVITDFGFANRFNESGNDLMATSCGSPCYAAPELVLQDGQYVGSAVDVWSCGVILYAMLSGYLPYDDDPANPDGDNINLLYKYITSTKLSFPDWISPEPRDLLQIMLVADPMRRCSLRDVMRHPWLRRYAGFFQMSVQDLEFQADTAYEEKKQLLTRQQQEYFRSTGQSPPPNMARSMSTPGVHDSTAQARHRSAMVTSTTMALSPDMALRPNPPPTHIPAPTSSSASRRAQVQSAIINPYPQFIDPFTSANNQVPANVPAPGLSQSVYATLPVIDPSVRLASAAMTPSTSAPGEVETFSDSLTSEGEMRGEPRSRRTDEDDASTTSSSRAPRNGNRPVSSMPATVSEDKKRKGDEKRNTVQLEYTSPPPAESTRSKMKQREIEQVTDVLSQSEKIAAATPQKAKEQPVFVAPEDPTQPILETAAAAENMDVHMQSPDASPANSMRSRGTPDKMDMATEVLQAPAVFAVPTVSPVSEVSEAPLESSAAGTPSKSNSGSSKIQRVTPPSSPQQAVSPNRTPRRSAASKVADTDHLATPTQESTRAPSTASASPKQSVVPFPSPKQERRPSATPMDRQNSGQENVRPATATSTKSTARHKKGMSTDKAFFSRLLGNSTTSIDRTDATGQGSRSRHSSSTDDRPVLGQSTQLKESPSTSSALDDLSGKRNRRRKALSLVVDPFSRSLTNSTASSAAKNRRSARVQPTNASSATLDARNRSGSVMTTATQGSTNAPSMASSIPVSPSMASVNANPSTSRQSVLLGQSQMSQSSYGHSQELSKSKRVSDWFRWKSVNRDSGPPIIAPPTPIQTDFDQRQPSRQSVSIQRNSSIRRQSQAQALQQQPTVVVTATTPTTARADSIRRPPTERTVATPAEARAFAAQPPSLQQPRGSMVTTRSLRTRNEASDGSTGSFDEAKLKMHSGATDRRMVTKTTPPQIMEEVRKVLYGMGMEVSKDSDFRYKCTRKSRKQLAATTGYVSQVGSPNPTLSPSPSSGFRAFFGRKNSSPQTSLIGHSPSMPSPALSLSASTMEGGNSPESSALSPTISNQSILPMPYFSADPSLDTGGEVRFTVEVVRVKGLKGLYTLDLRRLKGNLTDYRENHETFIERLKLDSAT